MKKYTYGSMSFIMMSVIKCAIAVFDIMRLE